MTDLIAIVPAKMGNARVNSVSARDLYLGLGLDKSNWTRWSIQNIIENGFFTEHKDWEGFVIMTNGNETRDFSVTLDFAKHLAMMAKTAKAHEYRNYFLACEQKVYVQPTTPLEVLRQELDIFNMFGIPLPIAQIESTKRVKLLTGTDFSYALALAPAQQNIKPEEVMLEPTELGKLIHMTARALNVQLETLGLQVKVNGAWRPTAKGSVISSKHSWTKGGKSGYNYKWNVDEVKALLDIM